MFKEMLELLPRVAELERRVANMMVPGRVEAVDPANKRVKLQVGTADEPMSSPWLPYAQIAGKLKVHTLPTLGQQMTLFNPAGDIRMGLAMPLGWTNDNVSPGDDDRPVLTFGSVRVEIEDEAIVATIDDVALRLDATGLTVSAGGSQFTVKAEQIRALSAEIRTSGKTVLNDGAREVVYKGSVDTGGDTNNQGAGDGVLV